MNNDILYVIHRQWLSTENWPFPFSHDCECVWVCGVCGFLFFHNKLSLIAVLFAPGMWNNWNLGGKKEAKPEGQKHNRVHGAVTTDKSCRVSSQIVKTIPGDFLRWDVALFRWILLYFMFSTKRKCLMPQTTLSNLSKFNLEFYSLHVWAKRSKYFIAALLLGFNHHLQRSHAVTFQRQTPSCFVKT